MKNSANNRERADKALDPKQPHRNHRQSNQTLTKGIETRGTQQGHKSALIVGTPLDKIIERFSTVRVLVIGDFIADVFVYGKPFRLSREAPVVIIRHEGEDVIPGGAGNAANNLASLGIQVHAVGLLGNDKLGNDLLQQLRTKKVAVEGMVLSHVISTTSKTRIMAGDEHTSKQQVIRIDRINHESIPLRLQNNVYESFKAAAAAADAVIVSDYGYGVVSRRIISDLRTLAKKKVVVVDSRYQVVRFRGVTAVTPNTAEAEQATRIRIKEETDAERAGRQLQRRLGLKAALITRGNRGMTLFEQTGGVHHIPIVGSDDVTDVTGAGDTVAAVFTASLTCGAGFYDAARLANYAASIVVMKSGTAVASRSELSALVRKSHGKG
ncbi:MAG TPA: PfkB family carbohydrate kinase [Thermodesulfobacteriota bacterium]|nr:PfkB family carbohydrate kinase [Thermodesulfobacteriota bacterium]